jgi:dsDNA-specific endonuclease/ATPase MutS2
MSELEGGMTGLGGFELKAKADRAENLQKKAELAKGLVRSDYDRITMLDQMVIKLETMICEVANIREYNSESADIIRELSSQLRQSPEKELRDLLNTWV